MSGEKIGSEFNGAYEPNAIAALSSTAVLDPSLPQAIPTALEVFRELESRVPALEVRQEQVECLDAIQEARINGQQRVLAQMATGTGKTTVVAADVHRFIANKPDARVLFLCHQNDILDQAQGTFKRILGQDVTMGKFTGENKDFHEVQCLFASFQAMVNWREAFLPDEFDYIVVDESHHSKARTYQPTLRYFQPEFMLGVTATPDRHDLQDIREIFGPEVYRLSLEEAIARELLSEVDYHIITDDVVDRQKLIDARGQRHSLGQLDRTIFAPKRNEEIVSIINERSEDITVPKRIIFCKSIAQAQEYASYFDKAAVLHSNIPKNQQDQCIRKFKAGTIDTLTVIDMFNEGIDIPDANQIIFLRSTESRNIFLQQLGRGLRKHPGKDKTQVLDFVANCDRLLMLNNMWELIASIREEHKPEEEKERKLITLGGIHFDDEAREILEILADLEMKSALYEVWSAEHSINVFLEIYEKIGSIPNITELSEILREQNLVSLNTLLRPFDGRYTELWEAAGINMPDGWLKVRAFARQHNTTIKSILALCEKHGLEQTTFPAANQARVSAITKEAASYLLAHTDIGVTDAPEGYERLRSFLVQHSVGEIVFRKLAPELGITPTRHRQGKKVGPFLSPEAQARLLSSLDPTAPKGMISVTQAVAGHPISKANALQYLEEKGFSLRKYRFGGPATEGLDDSAHTALQEYLNTLPLKADETDISLRQLQRRLRMAPAALKRTLEQISVPVHRKYYRSQLSEGISRNGYETLLSQPGFEHFNEDVEPPIKLNTLRRELKIGDKFMKQIVQQQNIVPIIGKVKTVSVATVSYEDAQIIRNIVAQLPLPPPPNAVSLSQYAKDHNVIPDTVLKLAEQQGVIIGTFRTFNRHRLLMLTYDQQQLLEQPLANYRPGP